MKIWDCFTFYNESAMLEFRLKELEDVVDYFVIIESNQTFSGLDKPIFFDKNLCNRYNIFYILVDDMPISNNAWIREAHQRNSILRGLTTANDNDLIIISDVDEIPDSNTLNNLKSNPSLAVNGFSLSQDFYYYNLTCKNSKKWLWPKILPYNKLKTIGSPQRTRNTYFPPLNKGGWHFSYFGNEDFIINKIKAFSHQEFNIPKITNKIYILDKIQNHIDLYRRPNQKFETVELSENTYLPNNYKMICDI